MAGFQIDRTGETHNGIKFIRFIKNNKHNKAVWLCQCHCKKEFSVVGSAVVSGNTESCGCTKYSNLTRASGKDSGGYKHGGSDSRLYRVWKGMRARCNNPKTNGYENYGGRGIKVCDEWNEEYSVFQDWALNHGYQENLTLDRIELDGMYEPENCRWVDWNTQARNKRAPASNESKVTGVTRRKDMPGKWIIKISIQENNKKKTQYVGSTSSLLTAIKMRREAENHYWGEEYQDFDSILNNLVEEELE